MHPSVSILVVTKGFSMNTYAPVEIVNAGIRKRFISKHGDNGSCRILCSALLVPRVTDFSSRIVFKKHILQISQRR